MQFTNIKVLYGITREVGFFWDMLQLNDGVRIECQPPCDQEKSVVPLWVSWLECNTRNHWEPLLFARCTAASQVLTVWEKFANDCCHIYKCMLQSVSLHRVSFKRRIWLNLLYTGFVVRWLPSTFVILQLNCYPGTTTTLFMEELFHFCFGLRGSGWFLNVSH